MVAADHPHRAVRLQGAADESEPFAGEAVVFGERGEAVPGVVDTVDLGLVRAVEVAGELEVVGRIGERDVDRAGREPGEVLQRVAAEDVCSKRAGLGRRRPERIMHSGRMSAHCDAVPLRKSQDQM